MRNLAIGAIVSFFATVFLLSFHPTDARQLRSPEPQQASTNAEFHPNRRDEVYARPAHRLEMLKGSGWEKRMHALDGGRL
jgi:hypothetical protein